MRALKGFDTALSCECGKAERAFCVVCVRRNRAGVNRNTAARIFRIFRLRIAFARLSFAPFVGKVEIDECYLSGGNGGRKVARQGRCNAGKFVVVGVAQRFPGTGTRRLKTAIIPQANRATLHAFACENVKPGSVIHTDQLRAYDLNRCGFIHKRVNHRIQAESSEKLIYAREHLTRKRAK